MDHSKKPKKGDVVYDPSQNPFNVVDVDYIIDNVHAILKDLSDENIKKMKDTDYDVYYKYMEKKYPKFCDEHYAIFDKVVSYGTKNNEDLSPLFYMLQICRSIKENNIDPEDAENIVGNMLQKKYGLDKLNTLTKK